MTMIPPFDYLSDLHLEFRPNQDPTKVIQQKHKDLIILAGDIGNLKYSNLEPFIKHCSDTWTDVVYVLGNHEYYNRKSTKSNLFLKYLEMTSKYSNVHLLDNDVFENDKYKIVGASLWSSPNPSTEKDLNDFKYIYEYSGKINQNGKKERYPIRTNQMANWNLESIYWLKSELEKKVDLNKYLICVSHFMPLMNKDIPNSKYVNSSYDNYYGNELKDLVLKTDYWVSGHTHQKFKIQVGDCLWVSNAVGYPGEL